MTLQEIYKIFKKNEPPGVYLKCKCGAYTQQLVAFKNGSEIELPCLECRSSGFKLKVIKLEDTI